MPGKRWAFTTRVEPVSSPYVVEMPGTAPGSTTFIPRIVYRHSRPKPTRRGYPNSFACDRYFEPSGGEYWAMQARKRSTAGIHIPGRPGRLRKWRKGA